MKVKGVELFLRQHPEFLENLPCPLCGESPEKTLIWDKEFVHCHNESCPMLGINFSKDEWNKRPGEEMFYKELVDTCYRSLVHSTDFVKERRTLEEKIKSLDDTIEKLKKHIRDIAECAEGMSFDIDELNALDDDDSKTEWQIKFADVASLIYDSKILDN